MRDLEEIKPTATFEAGALDVEEAKRTHKRTGIKGLTISSPPLLVNAESTSFVVVINGIKALGCTAGQDIWQAGRQRVDTPFLCCAASLERFPFSKNCFRGHVRYE